MGAHTSTHLHKLYTPKISYFDCMRCEVAGKPLCVMTQTAFTAWLESRVSTAADPAIVREALRDYDPYFLVDRWQIVCTLLTHSIGLELTFDPRT